MFRLKRLIHEIHRRSLWQVLSVYLISSWIALQVADTVTAALGLPDWVPQLALVLLIVLLPVVLATAFVQEGVGGAVRAEPGPETEKAEGEPTPEIPAPEPRTAHHRVFTWRNAIAAAVAMLALLTVSAGGYMGLRAAGIGPFGTLMSKGVLEQRDRIVLADFENHTPDSLLAMAATELFRTALSQSLVVNVADQEYVAGVLRRMEKEPGTALDFELAREVAIREGLKAVIAGEVISVGAGYVVSARLVAAEPGRVLWTDGETADESTAIIPAVDRLTRRLRERIGESLKSIRPNEPLAEVTTSSLQALKKYSQARQARRLGDITKAITLYEEAIALDAMFASAYRSLGNALSDNFEDRQRAVRAFTRAYELRQRLTELERYKATAYYYYRVTREFDRAATTLRSLLDSYEDRGARNLLANTYYWLGEYALAEPLYKQNLAEDTLSALAHDNLLWALVAQSKFDEAQATLELMARRVPNHPWYRRAAFRLATVAGDYESAEAHVRALRQAERANLLWRAATSRWLAELARLRGQLDEFARRQRDAMAANERRELPAECLRDAIELGATDAWFHGPSDRAERIVKNALHRYPLDTMEPLDRPYMRLAFFYTVAGNTERARLPLAEFEAEIGPLLRTDQEPVRHLQLSLIALHEGRTVEAIEEARIALESTCPYCRLPALFRIGSAYDNVGEADSAVAYYEQWLDTPYYGTRRSYELPKVYERLGDLYEQRGDTAKAIYHYGKLVEFWQDADPELQPRVEAARRAIEALSPDT